MKETINNLKPHYKTWIATSYDFAMIIISFSFSLLLRYEGSLPFDYAESSFITVATLMMASQLAALFFCGIYKGIWRYSSTPDLIRLVKGVFVATVFSFIVGFIFNRLENIPRSFFAIDFLLLLVLLGGGRFSYRIWKDRSIFKEKPESENTVVIGAGFAGIRLAKDINSTLGINSNVIGFIDDDIRKSNKYIHGIPVMGRTEQLKGIVNKNNVSKVFIAIPSATDQEMQRIIQFCNEAKVSFKTLPKLNSILNDDISFKQLRNVEPEDLLGRKPIKLDTSSLMKFITDKVVLVSGAGGSIGSELCNQIAAFSPKTLVLFELSEIGLYTIEMNLKKKFPDLKIVPIIGDVRNKEKLTKVLKKTSPEIIFHAAAYKHVPIMESNPSEAINTNVVGTDNIANVAGELGIKKFVLISTDKAVNPTNIMGTSKRIAEICLQRAVKKHKNTKFMTVRFGNVLGSSGSVIPLFTKQIEEGGPLTVTHKDITRYFMSIPEAAQLVLQAGAIGQGGEIFILDMGEPVKILDLAKQMIAFHGLKVDQDVKIEISGLRPGEKLYEELLMDTEKTLPTIHPKVRIAQARKVEDCFESKLNSLLSLDSASSASEFRKLMIDIVPEYNPQNISDDNHENTSKIRSKDLTSTH